MGMVIDKDKFAMRLMGLCDRWRRVGAVVSEEEAIMLRQCANDLDTIIGRELSGHHCDPIRTTNKHMLNGHTNVTLLHRKHGWDWSLKDYDEMVANGSARIKRLALDDARVAKNLYLEACEEKLNSSKNS